MVAGLCYRNGKLICYISVVASNVYCTPTYFISGQGSVFIPILREVIRYNCIPILRYTFLFDAAFVCSRPVGLLKFKLFISIRCVFLNEHIIAKTFDFKMQKHLTNTCEHGCCWLRQGVTMMHIRKHEIHFNAKYNKIDEC